MFSREPNRPSMAVSFSVVHGTYCCSLHFALKVEFILKLILGITWYYRGYIYTHTKAMAVGPVIHQLLVSCANTDRLSILFFPHSVGSSGRSLCCTRQAAGVNRTG